MSRAEAQARLIAACAAQAFSDEQRRLAYGAELVDANGVNDVLAAIA